MMDILAWIGGTVLGLVLIFVICVGVAVVGIWNAIKTGKLHE